MNDRLLKLMSAKSDFQIAFEDFQKDMCSLLLEEAACSPFFRESATFPLPPPPTSFNSNKKKAKSHHKPAKEEAEAEGNADANEETKEKEAKEVKEEKEFTTDEIDQEIIACSKRSQADLKSNTFMKNVKRKLKGVERQLIRDRIEVLLENGSIVQKKQEEEK